MMWMCWLKGISRSICLRNSSHWRWGGFCVVWPRGLIDDLAQELRANVAFAARAGLILQRPKPTSDIAPSPLSDLVIVHADPPSDGTDAHSLGRQLYDSRSLRQPLRGALGAYQLLQLRFFSGTQHELSTPLGHPNIQACSRQLVTII